MAFRVVAGTNIGADVVKKEGLTEAQAFALAPSYIGSYDRVEIFNNFESSPRARWNRKGENLVDKKAAKKQEREDEYAARDKKSQDNKDRLQNEDKQRRSEANERRAIKEQNRKEKWSNADKAVVRRMNDGVIIAPLIDRIIRKALIGALLLIVALLFATFLGEAILYLSSALSWVSYPFHFLFGNTDFFDLKSLTGSQLDGGGLKGLDDMLVLSGQFWLDFLILLVVSAIAVFIFYKTTKTRNISLAVISKRL